MKLLEGTDGLRILPVRKPMIGVILELKDLSKSCVVHKIRHLQTLSDVSCLVYFGTSKLITLIILRLFVVLWLLHVPSS